ncbi:uncharacterized protein LOC106129835 [Amyelois transitella]|uniref:uncharacterized protein LOC106129835 n=1 Tax=Amyelois transitella TaxID=680683 RepID=UPI00067E172B|nr:uncharacterized protein LOC106129835 [Amyelois transitella]
MDEELNENELEERLYAMLHYVDETQANVKATEESETINIVENAQRSTIRRYWRTSGDYTTPPTSTQYQKNNVPKEPPTNKTVNNSIPQQPKEEKSVSPTTDQSIFQPQPRIIQKTIEILDNEEPIKSVELESSDEDEVIEVALPPKPTITIESSDDDDVCIVTKSASPAQDQKEEGPKANVDRESTSPVPSVVSSVSDDFIRGDCIALNISSRHADNHTFDFSLHGSDLLEQTTPSKKRKKKKGKEITASTPVAVTNTSPNECFATPKSKVKQKKQKSKSIVSGKIVTIADVFDSDSEHSVLTKTTENSYIVTEKSLPSADVYDSDSNQSEIVKENVPARRNINNSCIFKETTLTTSTPNTTKSVNNKSLNTTTDSVVDLTDEYVTLDETAISESIVMANVTGFVESNDYEDEPTESPNPDLAKLGSTKIPPILYDNLDFDNLKGNEKVCKRRKYSLTTLRAEMEKFYNESWGGEDFNHREIQKYMSRDKNLWVIDPKDRTPGLTKRRQTCHYCDRPGHRDDTCRFKPAVCYMCGSTGHYEPRCPAKICVNCGSPNQMYSSMCRNCSSWHRITCAECGQLGHPASHCPDLWRRYHNTIDINMPLEENRQFKKYNQQYCSGCTRRGHLVHTCRVTIPFSGLPINSPYVSAYRPLYLPTNDNSENTNSQEEGTQTPKNNSQDTSFSSSNSKYSRNKRQSKSPCLYETQKEFKKKKQTSLSETSEFNHQDNESTVNKNGKVRNISTCKDDNDTANLSVNSEKALDFIPISPNNRDKKGHMIQDNEVSDTSDVVTLARIYITNDIVEKLKTVEGQEWLNKTSNMYDVIVQNSDLSSFLTIKGKVADQESFQTELRNWTSSISNNEHEHNSNKEANAGETALRHIPKSKKLVLKVIGRALDSLNDDLGEPNELYKRLTYLQKQRKLLLKQKVISADKLSNSTDNLKMVLKKLNMVLLGQAGLANGRKSLRKLHALQQKVIQLSGKTLPVKLRKEIAQHYQSIFVAIERNDYSELLQKYQGSNDTLNRNKIDLQHSKTENHENNSNISPRSPNPATHEPVQENSPLSDTNVINKVPHGALSNLVSYRQKVRKFHPKDKLQKNYRNNLLRRLHIFINCLFRKEQVNAKLAKKLKRVQLDACRFLMSNV